MKTLLIIVGILIVIICYVGAYRIIVIDIKSGRETGVRSSKTLIFFSSGPGYKTDTIKFKIIGEPHSRSVKSKVEATGIGYIWYIPAHMYAYFSRSYKYKWSDDSIWHIYGIFG